MLLLLLLREIVLLVHQVLCLLLLQQLMAMDMPDCIDLHHQSPQTFNIRCQTHQPIDISRQHFRYCCHS